MSKNVTVFPFQFEHNMISCRVLANAACKIVNISSEVEITK